MKIVFVGNHGVSFSTETHHANTLEKMGHEVIRLQEGQAPASLIWQHASFADLLIWTHTHGWETQEDGISREQMFDRLKQLGIPSVSYHLDLWLGIQREKDLTSDAFYNHIEYFFATDKLMADWFNNNTNVKGYYIPAGVYEEEAYIAEGHHEYANDVVFVGSKNYHPEWEYRPRLVEWLSNTYGAKFSHVGGDGMGVVRGHTLNSLYASSKVAVGDTLCIGYDYPYYFSDRLFETTGRGGFLIFPHIEGIEEFFEVDKEIVTYQFNMFSELKAKIDYYLEHDDEREAIRKAGHERTKKDHTYRHRWEMILGVIHDDKS